MALESRSCAVEQNIAQDARNFLTQEKEML
jgi:hypothetical protein